MWSSRNSSDGQRKRKALETSNFAQTCNLLSRYMKEKGSLRDLNLEIGGKVESLEALVKPGSSLATPSPANSASSGISAKTTSENPIIVVEDDSNEASTSKDGMIKESKKSAQLTIFYSGKVLVFDDFPAEKVREVVHVAKKSSSQMSYGFTSISEKQIPVASTSGPREGLPPRPQAAGKQPVGVSPNTFKEKVSDFVSEAGPSTSKGKEELSPSSDANGSDLPIARRSSLHRFLEKRKDRAALRGPYHNHEKEDESIDLNNFP